MTDSNTKAEQPTAADWQITLPTPLEVAMTDRHALASNVAENGRWFCALIAAIALYCNEPRIAFGMALVIGACLFVDGMPAGRKRAIAAVAVYVAGALWTISLGIKIGWP